MNSERKNLKTIHKTVAICCDFSHGFTSDKLGVASGNSVIDLDICRPIQIKNYGRSEILAENIMEFLSTF